MVWALIKADYPNIISKAGPLIQDIVSNFAQDPEQLNEIKALISDQTGSWDIPSSSEPSFYKFVRRGIERALQAISFRSQEEYNI